ncbi:MAG: hypothetical protein JNL32_00165 [Candidatus Kapabacteria bacterium]|nr:hypothetical protein [Candidatus Kapabacteria bacterium]
MMNSTDTQTLRRKAIQGAELEHLAKCLPIASAYAKNDGMNERRENDANAVKTIITEALEQYDCTIQPLLMEESSGIESRIYFWMHVVSSQRHGTEQATRDETMCANYIEDLMREYDCAFIPCSDEQRTGELVVEILTNW